MGLNPMNAAFSSEKNIHGHCMHQAIAWARQLADLSLTKMRQGGLNQNTNVYFEEIHLKMSSTKW